MPEPITRRDFLRRGVKYGGAAVFVVPAINVLSMAEAGATTGGSSYGNSRPPGVPPGPPAGVPPGPPGS